MVKALVSKTSTSAFWHDTRMPLVLERTPAYLGVTPRRDEDLPRWRNWQTCLAQNQVSLEDVGVQVSLSAL